jgi:hypothetical protein
MKSYLTLLNTENFVTWKQTIHCKSEIIPNLTKHLTFATYKQTFHYKPEIMPNLFKHWNLKTKC